MIAAASRKYTHDSVAARVANTNRRTAISVQVNSVLHPSGVAKSSASFGWGKGGNVTSIGEVSGGGLGEGA